MMNERQIAEHLKKLKQIEEGLSQLDDDSIENGITDDFDINLLNDIEKVTEALTSLENDVRTTNISPTLNVNIKKLRDDAVIPSYSVEGDAGQDLTITHIINQNDEEITYGYGIAMEIPPGYVGLIFPRSSVRKKDILLSNCVGVIDSGYRGEIITTFKKMGRDYNSKYEIGDRGAQILILPYPKVKFNEVNELSNTERGTGGFGHTGK